MILYPKSRQNAMQVKDLNKIVLLINIMEQNLMLPPEKTARRIDLQLLKKRKVTVGLPTG
jgi:hypothetical protein